MDLVAKFPFWFQFGHDFDLVCTSMLPSMDTADQAIIAHGNWEVAEQIGQGAFGTVHLCKNLHNGCEQTIRETIPYVVQSVCIRSETTS